PSRSKYLKPLASATLVKPGCDAFTYFSFAARAVDFGSILLPIDDFPSIWMQYLTGNIRSVVACQEHVRRGYFHRLAGPFQGYVCSELRYFLLGKSSRDQRCPDRPGSDAIDTDAFIGQGGG